MFIEEKSLVQGVITYHVFTYDSCGRLQLTPLTMNGGQKSFVHFLYLLGPELRVTWVAFPSSHWPMRG